MNQNHNLFQDFYEFTQETVRDLNQTDRQLFDFVVKNMDQVKNMSIQKFAQSQYLSTTTIFRFTQKLGFSGYADFINSLVLTTHTRTEIKKEDLHIGRNYAEEYLKNTHEAVRGMAPKQVEAFVEKLYRKPRIYILTDDSTQTIGQYCERLFIGLGFHAYFPETSYQMQNLSNRIRSRDIIIALSFTGECLNLIDLIERVFLEEKPYLMSITRADNNTLESLSDANFYVFADEIKVNNMDLTSSVPMLMIIELLIYEYLTNKKEFN